MKSELTYERLHEVLEYSETTGIFHWLISPRHNVKAGDIAGCIGKRDYIVIMIDGKNYFAHRLAWFYVKGYFPEKGIDHKDRVHWHNWIKNLRDESQQCNIRNTGNWNTNTSGVKGVYFNKEKNKWNAQITVYYSRKHLGYYKDFSNAVCARLIAEQCLGWEGCDGSSPAYQYVTKNITRKVYNA